MEHCNKCLHKEVCESFRNNICFSCKERHQEYVMNENGTCYFYEEKEPCNIGDVIWDKDGTPLKVLTVEKFPKDIHLHCEIWTPTGGKKTVCIGKKSIGRSVFLTEESFLERQKFLKEKGSKQ